MSEQPGAGSAEDAGSAWAGPWANDAQRLFAVLRDVADQAAQGVDEEHAHANAAECRYCPFCSGLAAFRRSGPDLLDRVADLAAGLAATWRAADRDTTGEGEPVDAAAGPDPGHDDDRIDLTGHDPEAAPVIVPPIQHIDISD